MVSNVAELDVELDVGCLFVVVWPGRGVGIQAAKRRCYGFLGVGCVLLKGVITVDTAASGVGAVGYIVVSYRKWPAGSEYIAMAAMFNLYRNRTLSNTRAGAGATGKKDAAPLSVLTHKCKGTGHA